MRIRKIPYQEAVSFNKDFALLYKKLFNNDYYIYFKDKDETAETATEIYCSFCKEYIATDGWGDNDLYMLNTIKIKNHIIKHYDRLKKLLVFK